MSKKQVATKKTRTKHPIDNTLLRTYLDEGKDAKFIMKAFNLTSPATLRTRVLKLMIEDNKTYQIPGLFGKDKKQIKAGKLGLRVPAEKLPVEWHKKNFTMSIDKENNNITLSLVTA